MVLSFLKKCRACLQVSEQMYPIFRKVDIGYTLYELLLKNNNSQKLKIEEDDGLSSLFCDSCTTVLIDFYNWSVMLNENQKYIKQVISRNGKSNELEKSSFDEAKQVSCDEEPQEEKLTFKIEKNLIGEPSKENDYLENAALDDFNSPEEKTMVLVITNEHEQQETITIEGASLIPKQETPAITNPSGQSLKEREPNEPGRSLEDFLETCYSHPQQAPVETFKVRNCDICDIKEFNSIDSWYQHHRLEHNVYRCEECGHSFDRRSYLTDHKEIHVPYKKFVCPFCGKAFKRRSVFRRHKFIHTNPRSFICENCGQAFNSRAALNTHNKVIHLKMKSFHCLFCNRSFFFKSSMNKHMERHKRDVEGTFEMTEDSDDSVSKNKLSSGSTVGNRCVQCNVIFEKPQVLLKHLKDEHGINGDIILVSS